MQPDEAWFAQLTTAAAFRGHGFAGRLTRYATAEMGRRGFRRLFGSVWHNHRASIRGAFERGGWSPVALVATARPFPHGRRLRVTLPRGI